MDHSAVPVVAEPVHTPFKPGLSLGFIGDQRRRSLFAGSPKPGRPAAAPSLLKGKRAAHFSSSSPSVWGLRDALFFA